MPRSFWLASITCVADLATLLVSIGCGAAADPVEDAQSDDGGECQALGEACDPNDELHGTADFCCSAACEQDKATGIAVCVQSSARAVPARPE